MSIVSYLNNNVDLGLLKYSFLNNNRKIEWPKCLYLNDIRYFGFPLLTLLALSPMSFKKGPKFRVHSNVTFTPLNVSTIVPGFKVQN